MQELGVNLSSPTATRTHWFGRTTTQQFAAPDFDSDRPSGLTFSDFLNLFLFNSKHNIGAVVKALQTKGLFQSLAEPNLIASNGKEASFLAGGEYPYPVAQGGSGSKTVTIQFKEFGVRLHFTPTVLGGDLINLRSSRKSARSTSPTASASRASACRRSRRAAPRRKSSCRTARRSRSPG